MNIENCWAWRSGLLGVLDAARLFAVFLGYFLTSIGWLIFVCGLSFGDAAVFRFAGDLVVPGWLLLRFAAGLFPFGRRLFRRVL